MRRAACLALAATTCPALAGGAPFPPEYAVANISEMLGDLFLSTVTGVNENGDATGVSFVTGVGYLAFVYTYEHGAFYLPTFDPHNETYSYALSDRDENGDVLIVGSAGELGADFQWTDSTAVYWRLSTDTGVVTQSVNIGSLPGSTRAFGIDVNNNGLILATTRGEFGGPVPQPFIHDTASGLNTPFTFPATPTAINNLNQIAGGTFIGDTSGSATNVGIPATTSSASIIDLNDLGAASATVGMPFTDGAGRFVNGAALYDESWSLLWANSAFDIAGGLNESGDLVGLLGISGATRPVVYFRAEGQLLFINDLITPTQPTTIDRVGDINTNRQIGTAIPATLLTPLGVMIIPGDVNGDAHVALDDLCEFLSNPIDLDGDSDIDADDEQWLLDRLASLGLVPLDCNLNSFPDVCDVLSGASADCNANLIPDECEADCDSDGVPDDCESDCNANGVPDDCDINAGTSSDCNANGIPDECDVSDTVVAGVTYDPPQLLLEDSTFTDTVLLTNAGVIQDVDFTLECSFRVGEITVILHHAGVSVTLIDQPGTSGSQPFGFSNLGYDITLDDEGAGPNIQTVGAVCCEFDHITSPPSYRPNQSLSAFDGLPRDGVWTLEFIGGFPQAFDPKLVSWSVIVTDTAVEVPDCSCPADLAEPFGQLDFSDVVAFLTAFAAQEPGADFAEPFGQWDFSDVVAFLAAFGAGCP